MKKIWFIIMGIGLLLIYFHQQQLNNISREIELNNSIYKSSFNETEIANLKDYIKLKAAKDSTIHKIVGP